MDDAAVPYSHSLRTSCAPEDVLVGLAALETRGAVAQEMGRTYLILGPPRSTVYTPVTGALVSAVLTIVILALTATSVRWLSFLPLCAAPLLPFLFSRRPLLAVGAVPEGDHTVVTLQGAATPTTIRAVTAFLDRLASSDATDLDVPAVADDADPAHDDNQARR